MKRVCASDGCVRVALLTVGGVDACVAHAVGLPGGVVRRCGLCGGEEHAISVCEEAGRIGREEQRKYEQMNQAYSNIASDDLRQNQVKRPSGPYATEGEAVAFVDNHVPGGSALQLPNGRWTVLQGNEDRETPPMGVWWEDWKAWLDVVVINGVGQPVAKDDG